MRKDTVILLYIQLTAFAGDKLEDFKRINRLFFSPLCKLQQDFWLR